MPNRLKIIADDQIPWVEELFGAWGEITRLPGRALTRDQLAQADILLVRSITPVNQALLAGTQVKFVGSATAGTDHLDLAWLQQAGIPYATTQGCNAIAVAEYVVACIAQLRRQGLLTKQHPRAGVIGVGHVGAQVVQRLKILGFEVLSNDPPRAHCEPNFSSTSLSDFRELDLICLHTPLTSSGECPTYQLINKDFLQQQKAGCVLLNAGRGEVLAEEALGRYGQHLLWCFDVWPHEPHINLAWLQQAVIATPHIAGYSKEAKTRAVLMLYQAAQVALHLPTLTTPYPLAIRPALKLTAPLNTWEDAVLAVYDPSQHTEQMRTALLTSDSPDKAFDQLRQQHPLRHEFASIHLTPEYAKIISRDVAVLEQLGFRCTPTGA